MTLIPQSSSDSPDDQSSNSTADQHESDIGRLLEGVANLGHLSRDQIYRVLKTEPNSDSSSYPRTRSCQSGSFRQFQPSWMKKHPWLHYSRHVDGVFCRACVLFGPDVASGQCLGYFLNTPFRSWIKMSEKANSHSKNDYHQFAMTKMCEFLVRYENPSLSVNTLLDSESRRITERNKKVIESLLKIVILCGKQGLPLRGHRDDNVNWTDEKERCSNEGNFIELVRFRAETDPVLANHLTSSPRNSIYTSKTIQNELVNVVGQAIQNEIIDEVKRAKFYSIIADETTDASNKEELSLVLRYVFDNEIKEVFVDFLEVERITGSLLGMAILKWLRTHDISPANMRGQCYDGASNMSGARSGCKTIVQQEAPLAMYVHCAAHRLNLALVSSCSIQVFKNSESYVGEIARFYSYSAKRQRLLDRCIDSADSSSRAKKLKDACRTRWVERIHSYSVFLELLPALHTCLDAIVHPALHHDLGTDWNWDRETVIKANGYLFQLQSSTFLVAFQILLQVTQILKELTLKLQMQAIDVVYAYKVVKSIVSTLKSLRQHSTTEFKKVFTESTKLGKQLNGDEYELCTPRVTGRQLHRSNPPSSNSEDYFRIALYDEFLSHIVAELETRFVENPAHDIALGLLYLLPSECINLEDDENSLPIQLVKAVEVYKEDLPHPLMIETEYAVWRMKWKHLDRDQTPTSKMVDAFRACSSLQFPNIHTLLQVALTLPITSCESERSFSQLKLVKTARRSTMSENI